MEPRIIKTNADYNRAIEEAESLIALNPAMGTTEAERLGLLSLLIEKYETEKFPIELPDPLMAIKFRMNEQGLKQRDLVPYFGSKSRVSDVLSGKRPLTVDMIRALNQGLDIPVEVLIQESQSTAVSNNFIEWAKFPLKEMAKRKWIKAVAGQIHGNEKKLVQDFFSPLGGVEATPVFFRRTIVERSGKLMDKHALWAWTAHVLIKADSIEMPEYNPKIVEKGYIQELCNLSLSETGPLDAVNYLAEFGIALVIEPHLPRTHLDGAALLSPSGRPVIGLTIRYDRIDNFWFNLLHELVHVLKHLESVEEAFVDDLDSDPGKDPREREADRLAGGYLIPRRLWKRSDAYRQRTPDSIFALSLKLRIHPAIIAGRVRHDTNNYRILGQMVGRGMVRKNFPDVNWP